MTSAEVGVDELGQAPLSSPLGSSGWEILFFFFSWPPIRLIDHLPISFVDRGNWGMFKGIIMGKKPGNDACMD